MSTEAETRGSRFAVLRRRLPNHDLVVFCALDDTVRVETAYCPMCSCEPVAIEAATARPGAPPVADLVVRCDCNVQWMMVGLTIDRAIEGCRAAIKRSAWIGSSHAALGMLLDVAARDDEAYEEYDVAGRCNDVFDRAFCFERRSAYEARHGWLRNALRSMRMALTADRRASSAREAAYRDAIEALERELTARGIWFVPADRNTNNKRWLRDCELELPPGFGARNELGEPLADDVIEIERLVRAERWDDAVAALRALAMTDSNKLIDAIGYASRGAERARAARHRDAAYALQEIVIQAYVVWASGASSGAEGMGRMGDVERERARLREWERE